MRRLTLGERWERRVQVAAHPVAYPIVERIARPDLAGGVRRVPGLGVVVADPEAARAVLLDTARFSKRGPGASSDLWTPLLGPSVLLNMHGEQHAALRRRLAPIFAPGAVRALVDRALAPAAEAMRRDLVAGARVDLAQLARDAASGIVSELVGLPSGAYSRDLYDEVTALTGLVTLTRPRMTELQLRRARPIVARLVASASDAYDGDESTVPGRMRALGLSRQEAMGAVAAFAITGTETLVSSIPRIAAILVDDGWLHRVDVPVRDLVEEGLRVTVPTPVMLRSTVRAGSVGTVAVRPGDRVVIATFAACRAHGPFDPTSDRAVRAKRLWFGAGPHYCIGAPLAMAQLETVLGAVVAAHREAPLVIASRSAQRGTLIAGYRSLVLARA